MSTKNEIADVLLALAEGIRVAATKLVTGGKILVEKPAAVKPAAVEEEEEAPPAEADGEKITLPAPDDCAELDKGELESILKAIGIEKMPALKTMKQVVEVLSRMLLKDKDGLKEMPTGDLRNVAELLGVARKKSADDQLKLMFKEINLEPFAVPSKEEEPPAEEEAPPAAAPEEEEAPPAEGAEETPAEEGFSEADAEKFLEETLDLTAVSNKKEQKAFIDEMGDWVKAACSSAAGKKAKAAVAALLKKGAVVDAYKKYMAQFVGMQGTELKTFEFDTAYIRGDQVYCNGVPLEETEEDNVGKDAWSGKLFRVTEAGEIEEVKSKKPAAARSKSK